MGVATSKLMQRSFLTWPRSFSRVIDRRLPKDWDAGLPAFSAADGPMATRVASGKTIAVLGARLPEMMGGSADLNPSTHTNDEGAGNFEPENWART